MSGLDSNGCHAIETAAYWGKQASEIGEMGDTLQTEVEPDGCAHPTSNFRREKQPYTTRIDSYHNIVAHSHGRFGYPVRCTSSMGRDEIPDTSSLSQEIRNYNYRAGWVYGDVPASPMPPLHRDWIRWNSIADLWPAIPFYA